MDLTEIGCEVADWIHLAVVDMVMIHTFPEQAENFMTS
jgi:hypothetical protein